LKHAMRSTIAETAASQRATRDSAEGSGPCATMIGAARIVASAEYRRWAIASARPARCAAVASSCATSGETPGARRATVFSHHQLRLSFQPVPSASISAARSRGSQMSTCDSVAPVKPSGATPTTV
jgi:hypothetical protein